MLQLGQQNGFKSSKYHFTQGQGNSPIGLAPEIHHQETIRRIHKIVCMDSNDPNKPTSKNMANQDPQSLRLSPTSWTKEQLEIELTQEPFSYSPDPYSGSSLSN